MTTATAPRVWLAATPADRPVVRDQMGRRWQPENHADSYRTADGRHHADWRELHTLFDLVEVPR
ncbi:hypothetical protein ATK30_0567 [Amycolatopsis echigonensis]|uniref:Uncharacterized protein n=1 Tax=Amycolatopsis echigonensis TaxID=2576905 RepID=A0A2N3X0F3_9PSEU|nr:hypothetical protein [Amycolatopsis niigatensis]PKV99587.1 hypothetical protein ATK30_0567 [Amycolatopsis niigatensis]